MTDVSNQKRMAADVLDVGESRVWIDPDRLDDVEGAITKQDIRNLIDSGVITAKDKSGVSRGRARTDSGGDGPGSRSGATGAVERDTWKDGIRAMRNRLKAMRDDGTLTSSQYRELYDMASGGFFRNVKHLELYVEKNIEE